MWSSIRKLVPTSLIVFTLFTAACAPGVDPNSDVCVFDPTAPGCSPGGTTNNLPVDAGNAAAADAGSSATNIGGHADAGSTDNAEADSGTAGNETVDAGATDDGGTDAGATATNTSADAGATATNTPDAGSSAQGGSDAGSTGAPAGTPAPTTYTAYTGTDYKPIPAAPALGPANYTFTDPTFGSRILRVTDQNTHAGQSLISTDAGFHRTFNADNTAIKLTGPDGNAYWLEFNAASFSVGDGSSTPTIHALPFGSTWEWSAVNPDIIYFLNGSSIATYNKSTATITNLGGPSNGDPATYDAVVIGADKWVCSVAGAGIQDSFTKFYCLQPANPSVSTFVDVANATINGVAQNVSNWPGSVSGETIGIHDISSSTGSSWLEITFHQDTWGANGGAVFNLDQNTWSFVSNADYYWSGHVFMGNGKYVNAAGSVSGADSRGMVMRNPDNLMDSSQYAFIAQPPTPSNDWCDADHSSWFNTLNNPGAPVLQSRYNGVDPSKCQFAWTGEITAGATDGSNTVWRFAHNHNDGQSCYYGQSFAQISNDGKWALFSSPWEGTLGTATGGGNFDCATRVDTFLVELK